MALEEDVDEATLNAIASYPSGKYIVRKDFYHDDNRVEELVLYRMCGLPDPTPAPPSEQNLPLFLFLIFCAHFCVYFVYFSIIYLIQFFLLFIFFLKESLFFSPLIHMPSYFH